MSKLSEHQMELDEQYMYGFMEGIEETYSPVDEFRYDYNNAVTQCKRIIDSFGELDAENIWETAHSKA